MLPQVGGKNARKTNKDYTKGKLKQLIDVIIEEKAALFVSAVGVPPKWCVRIYEDSLTVRGTHPTSVCYVVRASVQHGTNDDLGPLTSSTKRVRLIVHV